MASPDAFAYPHNQLVGWAEACGETQHATSLSRIFGFHPIAGFHSLRASTQPTGQMGIPADAGPGRWAKPGIILPGRSAGELGINDVTRALLSGLR
jgi:hypothetical protein